MTQTLAGIARRLLIALGAACIGSSAWGVDVLVSSFTDNPDPGVRGGNVTFTVTAENNDADTANGVVVSFPLPASTQFFSAADTVVAGACVHDGLTPGTVTCSYPTLLGTLATPSGPVRTINVVLRTTGTSVSTLSSTVTVSTTDTDGNPANNTLSQNTTIDNGADLSAAMTGAPDPATGGGLVTWTVTGSNLGPNTSGAVTYVTTLPGVLTYVAAGSGGNGWTCGAAGQVVNCTRAAVALGAYPTLPIVTRITGVAGGTVTVNGSISSTVGDPNASNNGTLASVTVDPGTDLSVTQDPPAPNPATSNNAVTFVLRPLNNGPYAATAGANVSFPLPAGFAVTSATGSTGWTCASAGAPATVTCTFAGSLASGAAGTLTVVATAPAVATPTAYSNITATIAPNAGGPVDPTAANNAAARSVTVAPDGVDLSITKSKAPTFVALGATMTSTIVVANAGPRTAASGSIVVTDALDATREQYVSFTGTNWSCVSAAPDVVCTYNAALAVATAPTLTITTQALAAGTATNTATAAYSGTPGDYNGANDSIAASVTITSANNSPDLRVTLAAATAGGVQTTVEANETRITYTATLLNKVIGTAASAQDVAVTLSIPGRRTTTSVAVTGTVLANTSGTSTAAFTCAGTGTGSTGNVVCTQSAGTLLSPGDSVTFTVTADRPLSDVTAVNATATAVSSSQGDPLPSDNTAVLAVTIDPIADVEVVSKVLGGNPVLAGTNATYTITVRNNGPSAAAAVSLADVFTIPGGDAGFTFVSAAASNGGTCSGLTAGTSYSTGAPTVSCSWSAAVAAASTRTVTVVVRPNWQAGTAARTLDNTATVSTTTAEDSVGGQGSAVNSRSLTLNISPAQVDLLVNNTDSPDPLGYDPGTPANDDVTYTVAESNTGPSLATGTGFTFTMTPPNGKTATFRGDGAAAGVAAANPSGTIAGSLCNQLGSSVTGPATLTMTCAYPAPGQLAAGSTQTRYLVFRVGSAPNVGGDVYNTNATVIVNESDSNAANDSESEQTTVRARADLSITKTPSINPVQLRQPFDWTIVVTNGGPGDSQTTGLTDTLPAGMAFFGAAPSWVKSGGGGSGSCTIAGQLLTCAFGVVTASQTVTLTVPVRMTAYPSGGTTQNCATATTSEVDPNSVNNLSVCTTLAVQRSSLAGTVFEDRDRAGANAGTPQSAATEPRLAGVSVLLTGTDAYGNAVSTPFVSGAGGTYAFTDLSPAGAGGYTVTETQPAGFVNGPADPPAPAATGSYARGGAAGNSSWSAIALAGNTAGSGYDFPEVRRPSLSGFVYIDMNSNGVRDAGTDIAVSGATVRLLDAGSLSVLATATTTGSGAYAFADLDPLVAYTLEEPLPSSPAGLLNGPVNPGLVNGAACASGCTAQPNTPAAGTDRIAAIDLGAGADGTAFNFGEQQQTSISGLVFLDANRNNGLDGSDTGRLSGVTIRLVQGADCTAGTTLQTTTTAPDGSYAFANVLAFQNYLVCETQPVGYGTGSANGTASSNVITITGLASAGSANNVFGETLAQIAGSVYQDYTPGTPANNDNGVRDAGELGIANVPVTLSGRDINNAVVNLSVTTDGSGNYVFPALLQSDATGYTLSEGAIPGASGSYADGRETAGSLGGSVAVNDAIGPVVVPAGGVATDYLFAELPIAPISGTVYLDRDRDGAIDATPTDGRIAGVAIRLVQGASCAAGTTLQTTTSAPDGSYSFSGATAGANYLLCETQPAGYAEGSVNPGTGASTPAANSILIANLPAAGSSGNQFGERAGSIAGNVFLDANNDGLRTGDAAIAGVTVTLSGVDAAGTPVSRTTTTDGTGAWRFDDVLAAGAGGYTVAEQTAQPVVAGRTTLNGRTASGSGGGSASAVAVTPSAVSAIALAAGADSTENNFAEILPVSIAGTVFIDLNNNGTQNVPGDAGIGSVAITVTGTDDTGAAVTRTATTAPDGSYALPDLRPGTYTVTEPVQPTGTTNGQTSAGSAGGTATPPTTLPSAVAGIVLTTPGSGGTGYNFAEIPNTSVVAGRAWLDLDNSGTINGTGSATEVGVAGVTIELSGTDLGGAAVARTTTTDASGNYNFANLSPGTYAVREPTQPAGTLNGTTVAGSTGGTATGPATTPSAISGIVVGVGQTSSANNFGELPAASIAGRVIGDSNNNGRLDAGEAGLANVALTLTGTDDLGNAVSATTTSDATGAYAFANLRPGSYSVTEPTQPAGTVNGITIAGSVNGTATGTATSPATTPSAVTGIALLPGASSINNDFAEIGNSPDLLVTKASVEARFTVANVGTYTIRVRNGGETATSAAYTVRDRLPAGLTLDAVPTGTGWACSGAVGASSFNCTSSDALVAGASNANAITVRVRVAAAALQSSPAINAVLVEGGGELPARAPSAAELDAFNNTPGNLPACAAGAPTNITQNACRTATPVQASASISGTAWSDVGSARGRLDGGDRRLPGWQVEVTDAAGTVVARGVTAADGTYRVADLVPGVELHVRFRDPQANIVWGYPVNGDTAPGSSGAACNAAQAIANGTVSSCAGAGADPTLTVVLAPGQNLPQQSLPVDPSGVVYDSGTRQAVPGAVVTLAPVGACAGWNPSTGLVAATLGGYTIAGDAVSMTVGNDGYYQYLFAPSAPPSCTFSLAVVPPAGFQFASALIPPTAGPLVAAGAPGSTVAVQPQSGPPSGPVGPATSYYLTLVTGSAAANVIHNHIPVDPAVPTGLSLSKNGDRSVVELGDSIRYTVVVQRSSGPVPRQVSVVDRLPAGFTFIAGTTTVNGVPIADPAGGPGPRLVFQLGSMPSSGQLVLQYRLRAGVGAQQGDGVNRAIGYGCGVPAGCLGADGSTPLPGSAATNEARFKVRVTGGVFGTEACVAGKVFVDCNGNHVQDSEEIGIPGVRLVLSEGTTLISDSEGKYSTCGLAPKSHVIRIDETTLPRGSRLTTSSNRNLGDAGSLWLDLKNGELHRADFIEGSCTAPVLDQTKARRAQGEVRSVETEKPGVPALRFDSRDKGPKPRVPASTGGSP